MCMNNKDADLESYASVRASDKSFENSFLKRPVRFLTVLTICLGLCLIVLSIYTGVLIFSDKQKPKTCLSEDCVTSAARIMGAMDKKVEPCDDFYEFACGGWVRNNPVPEWSIGWSQLAKLEEGLERDLRELLEDGSLAIEELPISVIKAKLLYQSCMNTSKLEDLGLSPIRHTLSLVGLPSHVPLEWSGTPWHNQAALARRTLSINALLTITVDEDLRNNSRNMLKMDQVSPVISEKYLLDPERFAPEIKAYRNYISAIVNILDPDADEKQFADDIITFSRSLANEVIKLNEAEKICVGCLTLQIMTPSEVRHSGNASRSECTISGFIKGDESSPDSWKQHDWKSYLDLVFKNTSVKLDLEDFIYVMDLNYLDQLSDLLIDTENLVVEKYLFWSVFSTISSMSLSEFRDLNFELNRAVFGQHQRKPRWRFCSQYVNDNFGHALSYLYVHRHFDESTKEGAIKMLRDIGEAFASLVKSLGWMDEETRQNTFSKLSSIRNFVGYPDWLFTPAELDKTYDEMDVVEGELLESHVMLTQAKVKNNLESLRKNTEQNRWAVPATTINALYYITMNSVTIPAAILQQPFYGNGFEALDYGSIGAVIGHEVTHGFDNSGRLFDANGNLNNWWSDSTLERFNEKVQCITDQYNYYHMNSLPNITVNGLNTQSENVADNGGMRAAFRALKLHMGRDADAKSVHLPGLPQYDAEQIFFLGFAQIWCSSTTVGALKTQLVKGHHSPQKIRVIGTLSNSQEFADAWKCPAGSRMNPVHKCVLW